MIVATFLYWQHPRLPPSPFDFGYFKKSNGGNVYEKLEKRQKLPKKWKRWCEISLDKLIDENWDFPSTTPTPEDIVFGQFEIERLRRFNESLTNKERSLFIAIYLEGMTEREYSSKTGIAQKTINDRKHRIRNKVEITFKKF